MNSQSISPRTVRIFISSPGDVAEERERARQVIEGLRRRYAGRLVLQPILWEDLPLQADTAFQEGIDSVLARHRDVEIAVFILWSRLGSALGPRIRKADGSEYRSGTEREFDLMMQARRQSRGARPAILAYIRQDLASFEERLRGKPQDERNELLAQMNLLKSFVHESFQDQQSGHNIGAYHSFDRPVSFSQRLRTHLVALLDELAGDTDQASWDVTALGPPFLGLQSFQPEHADIFFGREEETQEARFALGEQAKRGCAFLIITGASGSGKSSLARAGVLPEILNNEKDEQVTEWRSMILTPAELSPRPVHEFVNRLAQPDLLPELAPNRAEVASQLCEDPTQTVAHLLRPKFHRLAGNTGGQVRLLLVLDQLEEIFAAHVMTAEDRKSFLKLLEALARSGFVWVLATARSDFYHQIQEEPVLARLLEGRGPMPLLPPKPDALQRLIEEPARLAGLRFEQDEQGVSLARRILRDASNHAEMLPLVEFVLRELFDQRAPDGTMSRAVYVKLGGVEGAVGQKAEETFQSLPLESQAAFTEILPRLVSLETDGGESAVRRWAPLADLQASPARKQLTDALIAGRFFTADQQGNAPVAGFSHEALLRCWPRITQWIAANREFLRMRGRVEQQQQRWEQQGSDTSLLLPPGLPLEEGRTLLTGARHVLSEQSAAFIQTSLDHAAAQEAKARRRRRAVLAAMSCLTCVAMAGGLIAWVKQREAETERAKTLQANAALDEQRQRAEDREQLAIDSVKKFRDAVANESVLKSTPTLVEVRKKLLQEPLTFFKELRKQLQADGDTRPASLARLGTAAFDLGDQTSEIGDRQDALQAFEEALEIRKKIVAIQPSVVEYQNDLAKSFGRLGRILCTIGQSEQGMKAYEAALEIRKRLVIANLKVTKYPNDLARTHLYIGLLLLDTGKPEEAINECQSALGIWQKLVAAHPSVIDFQDGLACSHNALSMIYQTMGKQAEALRAIRSALEIQQKLVTSNPTFNEYQYDLAKIHLNLGNILNEATTRKAAMQPYEDARKILKKLVDVQPTVSDYQFDLARTQIYIGSLLYHDGKFLEALDFCQSALEIQQKLVISNATVIEYQDGLAESFDRLGSLLIAIKKPGEALNHYQSAQKIWHGLDEKFPSVQKWARKIEKIRNIVDIIQTKLTEADSDFSNLDDFGRTDRPALSDLSGGGGAILPVQGD